MIMITLVTPPSTSRIDVNRGRVRNQFLKTQYSLGKETDFIMMRTRNLLFVHHCNAKIR
jgi:hypothetical protein